MKRVATYVVVGAITTWVPVAFLTTGLYALVRAWGVDPWLFGSGVVFVVVGCLATIGVGHDIWESKS